MDDRGRRRAVTRARRREGSSQLPRWRRVSLSMGRSSSRNRSDGITRDMVGHRRACRVGARCASPARARDWSRTPRVAVLASLAGAVLAAIVFVGVADAASLPLGPSTGVALPANAFYGPFSFPPGPGRPYPFGYLSSVACPPSGACVAVGTYAYNGEASRGDAMVVSESDGVWNRASEIVPPSSSALYVEAGLFSVACPAAGSCVAIGSYLDSADEEQAMAVSESDGVWGQAIEIPGVVLQSIACRAPGSCVAIGTVSGDTRKMVGVIESGGVWSQPQGISLPANDVSEYGVQLAPLACQVSGPCVTVGSYTDSQQQRAMGVSESNGTWAPASEIKSAPDLEGAPYPYSVACPASGPCVADGLASVAFGVSETNGEWGEASPITPPPDPLAKLTTLDSVGCPRSGQCFAVGHDETGSSGSNAVVAGASGGVWGQAREIAPPPNAASQPDAHLRQVACSASESCVAIGDYTDSSGNPQAMAVTETGGKWGRASEITAPPTTSHSQTGDRANLELVACPALGTCAALGRYQDESGTWLMAAGMTPSPEKTTEDESGTQLMAPGITTAPKKTTAPFASVSLVSPAIAVQRNGRAAIKLSCRGTVKCAGSLRLATKTRPREKRHPGKTEIIAISKFAVAPDTTAIIELKLNAAGRSLLKAAHGRLGASLTVMETSPTPSHIDKQSVRLTQRR
jgi:hypothetical protein